MVPFLFCLVFMFQISDSPGLQVEVSGIKKPQGQIMIAVYDNSSDFLGDRVVASLTIDATGETVEGVLAIPFGAYAISVFHDENSDGELNTNFFGIPKEKYGFSNDAKGSFGPPDFDKAQFSFNQDGQKIEINLQ